MWRNSSGADLPHITAGAAVNGRSHKSSLLFDLGSSSLKCLVQMTTTKKDYERNKWTDLEEKEVAEIENPKMPKSLLFVKTCQMIDDCWVSLKSRFGQSTSIDPIIHPGVIFNMFVFGQRFVVASSFFSSWWLLKATQSFGLIWRPSKINGPYGRQCCPVAICRGNRRKDRYKNIGARGLYMWPWLWGLS